jgi:hypothetical protein
MVEGWRRAAKRLNFPTSHPLIPNYLTGQKSHTFEARSNDALRRPGPSSVQVLIFLPSQAETVPIEPFQLQGYP